MASNKRKDLLNAIDNAENNPPQKTYGGIVKPEFFDTINETSVDEVRVQELETRLAQLQELETVVNSGGAVVLGRCTMTPVGLKMPSDLSFEEWSHIGETLFHLQGSLQWMVGDWLAFGEKSGYGEAKAIAEKLGKNAGTLHNWAWVSRQLPQFSYRYEVLTHTHHQVVVSLAQPEQYDYWLGLAAQGDVVDKSTGERKIWSVSRLREAIEGSSGEKSPAFLKPIAELEKRYAPDKWKNLTRQQKKQVYNALKGIVDRMAKDFEE